MEEEIVSEKTNKPIRDEQTLAKVLEAAYVMQEHNRELRERKDLEPKRDHPEKEERAAAAPPHGPSQTQQPEPTPKADEHTRWRKSSRPSNRFRLVICH